MIAEELEEDSDGLFTAGREKRRCSDAILYRWEEEFLRGRRAADDLVGDSLH
jgi:hypothetical protein